jgi:hypothetical protein
MHVERGTERHHLQALLILAGGSAYKRIYISWHQIFKKLADQQSWGQVHRSFHNLWVGFECFILGVNALSATPCVSALILFAHIAATHVAGSQLGFSSIMTAT